MHAFCGQVLLGRDTCLTYSYISVFVSPARASRALAVDAISWTSPVYRLAGLYGRPAPARVHERVRLPLASRLGVDKLVHGQRTSIINRPLALVRTRPCPHTSRRYKVLEESLRIRSATGEKPYSICTTKYL